MPIERPYATFCLLTNVYSVIVCEIFVVEMLLILNLTFRVGQGQLLICLPKDHTTLYLLAIAMFALSVTICVIFSVEMCMTLTLTFRLSLGQI